IRFRRRFSLPQLQLAAATLMGLMCVGYGFSHNFLALMAASTIYGLAGGVDIGTATNYIYTLAPVELKATAQTMYGSVSGLAYIGGSLAGGILIDMMGTRAFFFLAAGITLIALLFLIGSIAFGKYVLHKEIPSAALRTHS
ncbi:MAG: MFS transporter, partial [Clostridia bacterium]|nr:MFS transporter [Clostridia bacterium]